MVELASLVVGEALVLTLAGVREEGDAAHAEPGGGGRRGRIVPRVSRLYRPWRYRSGPSIEGNPRPTCLLHFIRDQRRASCGDRAGARFPRRGRTRTAARLPAGLQQGRARPAYRFPLRPRDARGGLRPRPPGCRRAPRRISGSPQLAPRTRDGLPTGGGARTQSATRSICPRARWLRWSLRNASCAACTALLGSRPGTGSRCEAAGDELPIRAE